jgi:predicted transcriptional regulator
MSDDNEKILSLMADGAQRSFKEIRATVGVGSEELQNELKRLSDDGLIEQSVVPDDDLYMITAKGLDAAKGADA